jgi:hypothetical protein
MKSKPKFRVGQVVCIQGMDMPKGCGLITMKISKDEWWLKVEISGQIVKQDYVTTDLRPLTAREIGPRRKSNA